MTKRPDQHNIDPAEAGATDYKNLPQTGRGHSSLDDTIEQEKHKLEGREDVPAPGRRSEPSREVREAEERAAARGEKGKEE
jgi:hypothetical protein